MKLNNLGIVYLETPDGLRHTIDCRSYIRVQVGEDIKIPLDVPSSEIVVKSLWNVLRELDIAYESINPKI